MLSYGMYKLVKLACSFLTGGGAVSRHAVGKASIRISLCRLEKDEKNEHNISPFSEK
jgi:hypothetical protein